MAISRAGVMFFADPVAAFGNIRRALRPGGRLAFICPQGGMGQLGEVLTAVAGALSVPVELPFAHAPGTPGPLSLADPDRIVEVLTGGGFTEVTPTHAEGAAVWGRDAEDTAGFLIGWSPLRHMLRDADPATVRQARAALGTVLRRYEDADAVRLRMSAWLVTARNPAG